MCSADHAAVEVTLTIYVTDSQPPVITLVGANPLTIECHSTFTDPGATALDACAGDLTSAIVVTGTVDANTVGSYTLHYNVKDPANNAAVEVTRTVNVTDSQPPGITVVGADPVTSECHSTFTDQGETALD